MNPTLDQLSARSSTRTFASEPVTQSERDAIIHAAMHAPHGLKPGIENYAQSVYERKFTPDYMREMNRSVDWWLTRWSRAAGEVDNV